MEFRMWINLLIPLCTSLVSGAAHAAEVTEMAPARQGDAEISYAFSSLGERLVEDGTQVGTRRTRDHSLAYRLSYSAFDGLAALIELPQTAAHSQRFTDASQMVFDPQQDDGTMLGTDALGELDPTTGSGLGGTWVGVRIAPIHRELFAHRGDMSSWRLELAHQLADKSSWWTTDASGLRGAGPGASGWRWRGAWSTQHRNTEPYVQATWTTRAATEVDIRDAAGTVLTSAATITPARTLSIDMGGEVAVHHWGDQGGRIDLDGALSFGYNSWQDIPSGVNLPSVLDASKGLVVTESESTWLQLRTGVQTRFSEYLEGQLGATLGTVSGHRLEHLYPVNTAAGALSWGMYTSLRFRAREF
jgi:hypothetical protein